MAQRVTKNKPRKPFARTGLHRLDCDRCSAYVYATVASLETHGFPLCACTGTFQPQRLELALMLGCDDSPVMLAYVSKTSSVAHGQAWTGRTGLAQPEQRAFEQIDADQRAASRARRIAALKPPTEPIPF